MSTQAPSPPPVYIPPRSRRSFSGRRLDHNFLLLTRVMAVVLVGYLLFDRTFAWIHVPGTPIFVGEIALVFGLWVIIQTPHLGRFIRISRPIQLLMLYMAWGFALAFEGYSNWGINAIRDSALWYYGVFALISGVLLLYRPELWDEAVDRLTRFIPVFFIILIMRLALAQASIGPRIPDSRTRVTAHKTANIAVNVAIALAFLLLVIGPSASKELRRRATGFTLLGLLLVLGAGTQSRGGFLAAFLILTIVFVVARHSRGVMVGVMVLAVMLGILAAALDVKFQLDRRELSVEQVVENIQSVTDEATSGTRFDNTTQWRLNLWGLVIDDVFRTERILTGFGFGENVALRYDSVDLSNSIPLRNPHNSHLSVLARMGVVGSALWVAMFASWYISLIRARRQFRELGEDRRASLAFWLMLSMGAILANAFFDPTLEGPQVGVLVWTLFGAGAVLGIGARSVGSRRRRSRRGRGEGDFDWLLLQEGRPISPAHPSLDLDEDLQQVVKGFDELLADDSEE
ncbi:MAG: O-antigen ligase family protein [Acidimicrobiia bacterium]|nr:O-antigen ligase family protein [Acidimicrobiia bacterium]NNF86944.1 O-antigen ligase family protein [Acidimicrobiia bacterium]NNJ46418.1 O-antigen ligase family protein [Acidimicrobiia bacterium]RZV47642.1 MAG: O-antigen ligase domain-containing protein [Acidimicrobiia bacterium]